MLSENVYFIDKPCTYDAVEIAFQVPVEGISIDIFKAYCKKQKQEIFEKPI